jgi:hypothetical protein
VQAVSDDVSTQMPQIQQRVTPEILSISRDGQ